MLYLFYMKKVFTKKLNLMLIASFLVALFVFPKISHAQINAQGIGGLLIQCVKVTSANKDDFGSSMDTAAQRAVTTADNNSKKLLKKEACGDAIAKYAMGELLKSMTQEALNWINNGFRGDPAFIQNPAAYFQSIATQQLSSLTSMLQFNVDLPFGRDAARNIILSEIGNTLEQRARYTLNNYIPTGNAADFHADFKVGGWDAFIAQGFHMGNNPGGFAILADQEKERRLAGRSDLQSEIQLASKELQQNGGFLNLKRCVESKANGEYIPPEEEGGVLVTEAQYESRAAYELYDNDDMAASAENLSHVCKTWVTETPGTLISHALEKTIIDIPIEQSIMADELNESLNVVFSALLNQVFKNGVSSLENAQSWAQEGMNNVNLGSIGLGDLLMNPGEALGGALGGLGGGESEYFGGIGVNAADLETAQGDLLGWSEQGENFDIFNQLPYIIYLQERFIGSQDGVIPDLPIDPDTGEVGIDQGTGEAFVDPIPGFNGVIQQTTMISTAVQALEQLDVCIPGPSPMYKKKANEAVNHYIAEIDLYAQKTMNIAGLLDPSGVVNGTMQDNRDKSVRRLKAASVEYMGRIDAKYNWLTVGNMPVITPVANNEIGKIDLYMDLMAKNETVRREVKDSLVGLNYLWAKILELQANAPNMPIEVVVEQGDALVEAFYEVAPNAVTAEELQKLRSAATIAKGGILYTNSLADQCLEEKTSSDYYGQTRFQWYTSRITGDVLGSQSYPGNPNNDQNSPNPPGDNGNFLANEPNLDYGQGEFGVILNQAMLQFLIGKLPGYIVLQTLAGQGIVPQPFSPGTMWMETVLGWSYPGNNIQ